MKTLKDIACGDTITVRKISGGRAVEKRLEALGVMSGSDLTLLEIVPDGTFRVSAGRRELLLSPEDVANIGIGEHFVRKGDPILLGGCCASGNMTEMLDRIENCFADKPQ